MNYPDGLTGAAICYMEGHNFRSGGICIQCGIRLRCCCGQFVRSDQLSAHIANCAVLDTSSRRTSDSTEDSGIRSYLRDDIRDDHIEALHWLNSPGPL